MPFSVLALRTDAEALANLGDPRFPTGGSRPLTIPTRLDRALRHTEVRGLQGLIDRLVHDEGYLRGDPEQPLDKDYPENPESVRSDRTRLASLFVVYYDWRRDIAESACLLANRVARIRARTGASRVYVVGHSLGGVVARYYARYGGRDVMRDRDCPLASGGPAALINAPGAPAIGGLVTLGAPHQGSAQAFRGLMQDFNLFGVLSVGLRDAVFTMPIAWQLLPFGEADGSVPLLIGANGTERVPLYEPQSWIQRGWVPGDPHDPERRKFLETMLARAKRLHQWLQEPSATEDAVPRIVLGSACRPTPPGRGRGWQGGVPFSVRERQSDVRPRHGAGGRRGESGQRLGNSRFPDAHHDERLHGAQRLCQRAERDRSDRPAASALRISAASCAPSTPGQPGGLFANSCWAMMTAHLYESLA
ncbi:MAG: hypothetical protein H6Q85_1045 [candidate division NC10 bacterium]|nr:hypothetical protein [candidate division NC10 bacterium]